MVPDPNVSLRCATAAGSGRPRSAPRRGLVRTGAAPSTASAEVGSYRPTDHISVGVNAETTPQIKPKEQTVIAAAKVTEQIGATPDEVVRIVNAHPTVKFFVEDTECGDVAFTDHGCALVVESLLDPDALDELGLYPATGPNRGKRLGSPTVEQVIASFTSPYQGIFAADIDDTILDLRGWVLADKPAYLAYVAR